MHKMRKDGEVSVSVLLKIATYLDCDISDICEFVKDAVIYMIFSARCVPEWTMM